METARRMKTVAVAVAIGISLTGCGEATSTDADNSKADRVGTQAPVAVDPQTVLNAFRLVSLDFTRVRSVNELASQSKLVIAGTIVRVVPGRIEGAKDVDDPFAMRVAAVAIRVDISKKGGAQRGSEVWLELPIAPQVLRQGLLEGLRVAAFLAPAPPSTESYPYGTQGSSVPVGESLWTLAHPEGLIVQYGATQGTVTPFSDSINSENTAREAIG